MKSSVSLYFWVCSCPNSPQQLPSFAPSHGASRGDLCPLWGSLRLQRSCPVLGCSSCIPRYFPSPPPALPPVYLFPYLTKVMQQKSLADSDRGTNPVFLCSCACSYPRASDILNPTWDFPWFQTPPVVLLLLSVFASASQASHGAKTS